MKKSDDEFIKSLKSALDDSIENLDAKTRSRLTAVRHQALEQQVEKRTGSFWIIPAGAFASLAIAMLVFNLWTENHLQDSWPVMEDLELLSSDESFELLEELEFYEWLESQTG